MWSRAPRAGALHPIGGLWLVSVCRAASFPVQEAHPGLAGEGEGVTAVRLGLIACLPALVQCDAAPAARAIEGAVT